VTETIEYEQFDQSAPPQGNPASEMDLSRLSDIPMELSVEIGRTHMTVGETLDLRVGSIVTLERLAGEAADLLVNGTAIARGEVVVIEEQYGLRITEILDGQQDSQLAEPAPRAVTAGEGGGAQDAVPAEAAAADRSPAGEG
jgi:flagellar motor switch protein FliN/FliY